jgi:hypothetical protein
MPLAALRLLAVQDVLPASARLATDILLDALNDLMLTLTLPFVHGYSVFLWTGSLPGRFLMISVAGKAAIKTGAGFFNVAEERTPQDAAGSLRTGTRIAKRCDYPQYGSFFQFGECR